jgi:hypothetical protein
LAQLAFDFVADLLQPELAFFTRIHRGPSPSSMDATGNGPSLRYLS